MYKNIYDTLTLNLQYNVPLALLMKYVDLFDRTHSLLACLLLLPIPSPSSHFHLYPTATSLSEIDVLNPFQIFWKLKTEMHGSHQSCQSPASNLSPNFKFQISVETLLRNPDFVPKLYGSFRQILNFSVFATTHICRDAHFWFMTQYYVHSQCHDWLWLC